LNKSVNIEYIWWLVSFINENANENLNF